MFVEQYFSEPNGNICFTKEQGSNFAKQVGDDFNPLHDKEASRFCVPGDLLFSIVLSRYGLSQHMEFIFSGMVSAGTELILPEAAPEMHINDAQEKQYMSVKRSGDICHSEALIEILARNYVEFSGHTFPHILVPLLAEQNMMINPTRPMVMYQSMSIDMDRLDFEQPALQIDHNELEIDGKRGSVLLAFNFVDSGEIVGRGRKRMLLSGLREYDEQAMEGLIEILNDKKEAFFST